MRIVLAATGYLALGLGLVGLYLPLLPTVPFLLLAAICFAQSSERMHNWLLTHPLLGPPITDWNERGAIRRSAKWIASVSIIFSFALSFLFGFPGWIIAIQGTCLMGVALFIWTRPDT